jgi:hypothetical protein
MEVAAAINQSGSDPSAVFGRDPAQVAKIMLPGENRGKRIGKECVHLLAKIW